MDRQATSGMAVVEGLEDRRLMAVSNLQVVGVKVAKAQDVDGTALNQNRITIAFGTTNSNGKITYAPITLVDAAKIRSFGYAEDLLNPGQQRKVFVGMTITHSAGEPSVLTITTDRLIRKGSRIFIELGALKDASNNDIVFDGSSAAKTITFTVGQNKPRYTMSNRNWRPTDLSYFTPDVFTSAPTPSTASSAPNPTTLRQNLVGFMSAKVTRGLITQAQADAAVALYDSTTVDDTFPTANLRAALASLVGTVAEPVINSYISTTNVTGSKYAFADFSSAISSGATTSETKLNGSNRLQLLIQPSLAGEDFRALSALLAHEAMHQDATGNAQGITANSQDEEIVANAVQTVVYIQQALVNNSFMGNGTALVNKFNEQVLSILNSGDTLFPYGGVKQAPALNSNGNVFVGAKSNPGGFGASPVTSFVDWIRREYVFRGFNAGGTNTNAIAVTVLKNIVGQTGNFTLFGSEVQGFLDNRNAILTDVAYIKMAQALKLTY